MEIVYPPRHDPLPLYPPRDMKATLLAMEEALREQAPHVLENLAAPANDADIAELLDTMAPYQPPPELLALYRWHNGQTDPMGPSFFPGRTFYSIRDALAERKAQLQFDWIRPWYPVFGRDGDFLILPFDATPRSLPVYFAPHDDTDLVVQHENLESMIRVAIDAFQVHLLTSGTEAAWVNDPRYAGLQAAHSQRIFGIPSDQRMRSPYRFSIGPTHVWPMLWKLAIGRTPADYTYHEPSATVKELLEMSSGRRAVVHARFVRVSSDRFTISDGTATAEVSCARAFRREVQVRADFEMDVEVHSTLWGQSLEVTRLLRISEGRN